MSARRFLTAAISVLAFAACDSSATDVEPTPAFSVNAAERTIEERFYDLDGIYYHFDCGPDGEPLANGTGELIRMEGKVYERIMLLRDGKGNYHFLMHTMPIGVRGVGVDSGEEFHAMERDHRVSNAVGLGGTGSYRQEVKLVGKRTKRTWWLVSSGSYRIDQDGNTTVSRDTERFVCKAGRTDNGA